MARDVVTGESHPCNDDVVTMRLAQTMVIDRIQLAVYCLSNCFAGKSLPASHQGHIGINIHNNNTVESGYLAHALIGITAKLYAPHSEVR